MACFHILAQSGAGLYWTSWRQLSEAIHQHGVIHSNLRSSLCSLNVACEESLTLTRKLAHLCAHIQTEIICGVFSIFYLPFTKSLQSCCPCSLTQPCTFLYTHLMLSLLGSVSRCSCCPMCSRITPPAYLLP